MSESSNESESSEERHGRPPVAPLTMTEVYCSLLGDLSNLADELDQLQHETENAGPEKTWNSVLRQFSQYGNNSLDVVSMFKKRAMDALCKEVSKRDPIVEPSNSACPELELKNTLMKLISEQRGLKQQMTTELVSLQSNRARLEKLSEDLDDMMKKRPTTGEMLSNPDLDEVSKKISFTRTKLVKDIRTVIAELYGENSKVNNILRAVFQAHFTNSPYIEADSSDLDVEHLLKCGLVIRHPDDPHQIRLVEFD